MDSAAIGGQIIARHLEDFAGGLEARVRLAMERACLYPGRYDQALRLCLDLMVRDRLTDDVGLAEAVATVAHLYSTIGRHADAHSALRTEENE